MFGVRKNLFLFKNQMREGLYNEKGIDHRHYRSGWFLSGRVLL